jgi:hypothetical protein
MSASDSYQKLYGLLRGVAGLPPQLPEWFKPDASDGTVENRGIAPNAPRNFVERREWNGNQAFPTSSMVTLKPRVPLEGRAWKSAPDQAAVVVDATKPPPLKKAETRANDVNQFPPRKLAVKDKEAENVEATTRPAPVAIAEPFIRYGAKDQPTESLPQEGVNSAEVPNVLTSRERTKTWFDEVQDRIKHRKAMLSSPIVSELQKAWAREDLAKAESLWSRRPNELLTLYPRPNANDRDGWAQFFARLEAEWQAAPEERKVQILNRFRKFYGLEPIAEKSWWRELNDSALLSTHQYTHGLSNAAVGALGPVLSNENSQMLHDNIRENYMLEKSGRGKSETAEQGGMGNANAWASTVGEKAVSVPIDRLLPLAGPEFAAISIGAGMAKDHFVTSAEVYEALKRYPGINDALARKMAALAGKRAGGASGLAGLVTNKDNLKEGGVKALQFDLSCCNRSVTGCGCIRNVTVVVAAVKPAEA